jgi:hypothetical protein
MMNLRTIETQLARLTLVALAVFALVETVASWQMFGGSRALVHPGYLGSVAGIVLLYVGARHSLRARPRRAPAVMCASHAWWAGVGWHAASFRFSATQRGDQLFYGSPELWATVGGAAAALLVFAMSLFLTYRSEGSTDADAAPVPSHRSASV